MNKKIQVLSLLLSLSFLSLLLFQPLLLDESQDDMNDQAYLAIVKNDQKSFEDFLDRGGKLESLVVMPQKKKSLGRLLVEYERVDLINLASRKQKQFQPDDQEMQSIWETTVTKNNSALYQAIRRLNPKEKIKNRRVGKEHRTLLQYASSKCSHNLIKSLESEGLTLDEKDKNGVNSFHLAEKNNCHPVLSHWKKRGAMDSIKTNKDLSLPELTKSLQKNDAPTKPIVNVVTKAPDFYKKRSIPKESYNRLELVEPVERPRESIQTAEYSEFSD
jgi:hypothetical protein